MTSQPNRQCAQTFASLVGEKLCKSPLREKVKLRPEMAYLCCGLRCRKAKDTKIVSLRGLEPDQWHAKPKKSRLRSKHISWMEFMGIHRPENWEEPSELPGQRMDDDLSDSPPATPLASPAGFNPNERNYQVFMRIAAKREAREREANPMQEAGLVSGLRTPPPLFAAHCRPTVDRREDRQQPPPTKPRRKSDGIHTDVRGAPPLPMPWKQMYVNVLKPREQNMALYKATAARNAQRGPAAAPDVSQAPEDSAERVEVRTPLAQRESRLQALKAQLRRQLLNRRRRRSYASPSREWTLETVLSDSEEGDEEDEILYSADQDREVVDGSESARESRAATTSQRSSAKTKAQPIRAQDSPFARRSSALSCQASHASCAQPINGAGSDEDVEEVLSLSGDDQEPSKPKKGNAFKRALKKMTKKSTRVDPMWADNNARPNSPSVGIQGPPDFNTASSNRGGPRVRTIMVQEMPFRTF